MRGGTGIVERAEADAIQKTGIQRGRYGDKERKEKLCKKHRPRGVGTVTIEIAGANAIHKMGTERG